MSSETRNLFGCPYCGYRVGPAEGSCPRCGNDFSDSTKFECPFCGDMVAPGQKECPSCHVDFEEFVAKSKKHVSEDSIDNLLLEIIKMESSELKHEEKRFSCPKCSWMLDGTETACPKCGEKLSEDAALQCPICGSFVNAESDKCPECGTPFSVEGEVVEKKEAAKHEEFSTALSDILQSASHIEPTSEIVAPPAEPEPVIQPEPEPVGVKEPEPVEEKVEAPIAEPAPELEPAPPEGPPKAAPKKARQRKLKAKPSGQKPV